MGELAEIQKLVSRFLAKMREKMRSKVEEGWDGWDIDANEWKPSVREAIDDAIKISAPEPSADEEE